MANTKVLAIYRDYLSYDRGTPLRVRSLLAELVKDPEIDLTTVSRDQKLQFSTRHVTIGTDNVRNIIILSKYIRKNKIDVIIFHTISAGYYLPFFFALNPFTKRVLEMHGFSEEEGKLYGDQKRYKYFRNKIFYNLVYCLSHVITTCSETASEKLRKINSKTYTVFGGVDLSKFNSDSLKKDNQGGDEKIVLGYSGNARLWQGLDFLIDSFSLLVKKDPRFELRLLLSNNVDKTKFSNLKNVELFQPTSHEGAARFNDNCDILVIPRVDNVVNKLSFPSKLMEYLAMGVPVVGSKTSDIHKIIRHNENGMLFEPGDSEGLINCLMKLRDPKLRISIGRNGAKTAEKYSWQNQGKLFASIIKGQFS